MHLINVDLKKYYCLASVVVISSLCAVADSFYGYDMDGYFSDRFAFNLYVGGASEITQRAEFASVSYDINTDVSIVMGSSVSDPRYFHYVDLSIHNPWTLWSLQSSFELGIGQYVDSETIKRRVSQSISFDYPLDPFFSLQLMIKRFTPSVQQFKSVDHLFALGLGMRV